MRVNMDADISTRHIQASNELVRCVCVLVLSHNSLFLQEPQLSSSHGKHLPTRSDAAHNAAKHTAGFAASCAAVDLTGRCCGVSLHFDAKHTSTLYCCTR